MLTRAMPTRLMRWLLAGCGALALGCAAVPAIVLLGLPTAHQAARQRWEQRGPRHYEFAAMVASGMVTYHVRTEVERFSPLRE
jgi:hypothetical protein